MSGSKCNQANLHCPRADPHKEREKLINFKVFTWGKINLFYWGNEKKNLGFYYFIFRVLVVRFLQRQVM